MGSMSGICRLFWKKVSPDRKGIIASGLKAVSRNRQNVLKPIDFVATYSNNGWTMYTTNAEASRQTEMCTIYNEAWGRAKRGIPLAGEEAANVENPQGRFDAKA